jgi:hypothetical protein
METQIFHHAQIHLILNPSRYYNFVTNLKFQHKPKNILFQKPSYKNRPIIIIIT